MRREIGVFVNPERKAISLRAVELPKKQIPRGKAARNDKACGVVELSESPSQPLFTCGKQVEMLWDVQVDRVSRGRYGCKVSRTVGFALVAGSPGLKRAAQAESDRSLTTRLNVPVVRERIRA